MNYSQLQNGFLSPSTQQAYLQQDVICIAIMKKIQTNVLDAAKMTKIEPILSNVKQKEPTRPFSWGWQNLNCGSKKLPVHQ